MGRLATLGVGLVTLTGALTVAPVRADALDASFQALAVADGVRVTVFSPRAPLTSPEGRIMDLGGPVAEALLDSIGQSTAFASFPFPGAGPGTAPALIRGASGGAIPAPDNPLFAQTKAPANPKQEFGSGPLLVKAESGDTFSASAATAGGDAGGGNALGQSKVTARVESTADAVIAQASSETAAVAVGPLRVGRVFSTASATFDAAGNLERKADTVLDGVSVDGNGAVMKPDGRPDLGGLNEALSGANITVEVLPQREADTGIVAPAVQVTQRDGSGGATVYTIGAASAFVDATLLAGGAGAGAGTTGPGSDAVDTEAADSPTQPAPAGGLAQRLVEQSQIVKAEPAPAPLSTGTAPLPAAVTAEPDLVLASSVPEGLDPNSERAKLFIHQADLAPVFLILLVGAALAVGTVGLGRLRGARG